MLDLVCHANQKYIFGGGKGFEFLVTGLCNHDYDKLFTNMTSRMSFNMYLVENVNHSIDSPALCIIVTCMLFEQDFCLKL
jgi:hypothetical protein